MEIEYQLTFDDFREAVASFTQAQLGRRGGLSRGRMIRGLLGWMIFAGVVAVFYVILSRGAANRGTPTWVIAREWLIALPWLGLILLLIGIGIASRKGAVAGGLFLLADALLLALAYWWLNALASASDDPLAVASALATERVSWWRMVPWWFLVGFGVLMILQVTRAGPRATWAKQSNLHAPRKLQLTAEGFVVTDALTRLEYKWDAIPKQAETDKLFLLYVNEMSFHIIPKRALPDADSLDAFRSKLRQMIDDRPRAFPVVTRPPKLQSSDERNP